MPRAAFIFRVDMDLKFCTIADNDRGWVPFGRCRRGEASGSGRFLRHMKRDRCFAPTLDHDDSMEVIRHYDPLIQHRLGEMVRDGVQGVPEPVGWIKSA